MLEATGTATSNKASTPNTTSLPNFRITTRTPESLDQRRAEAGSTTRVLLKWHQSSERNIRLGGFGEAENAARAFTQLGLASPTANDLWYRTDLLVLLGRGPTQNCCRAKQWRVEVGLNSSARACPRRGRRRLWQESIDQRQRVRCRAGEQPAETGGDHG